MTNQPEELKNLVARYLFLNNEIEHLEAKTLGKHKKRMLKMHRWSTEFIMADPSLAAATTPSSFDTALQQTKRILRDAKRAKKALKGHMEERKLLEGTVTLFGDGQARCTHVVPRRFVVQDRVHEEQLEMLVEQSKQSLLEVDGGEVRELFSGNWFDLFLLTPNGETTYHRVKKSDTGEELEEWLEENISGWDDSPIAMAVLLNPFVVVNVSHLKDDEKEHFVTTATPAVGCGGGGVGDDGGGGERTKRLLVDVSKNYDTECNGRAPWFSLDEWPLQQDGQRAVADTSTVTMLSLPVDDATWILDRLVPGRWKKKLTNLLMDLEYCVVDGCGGEDEEEEEEEGIEVGILPVKDILAAKPNLFTGVGGIPCCYGIVDGGGGGDCGQDDVELIVNRVQPTVQDVERLWFLQRGCDASWMTLLVTTKVKVTMIHSSMWRHKGSNFSSIIFELPNGRVAEMPSTNIPVATRTWIFSTIAMSGSKWKMDAEDTHFYSKEVYSTENLLCIAVRVSSLRGMKRLLLMSS